MNTKLVVPPMPEYHDMPSDVDEQEYLHGLLTKAQRWGSLAWQTAQRESALADELAVMLEKVKQRAINMDPFTVQECDAVLAKHKEARNG